MVRLICPLRLLGDLNRYDWVLCFTLSSIELYIAYLVIVDNTLHHVEDDPTTTTTITYKNNMKAITATMNPQVSAHQFTESIPLRTTIEASIFDSIRSSLINQATAPASLSLPTTIVVAPTSVSTVATISLLDAISDSLDSQATTTASLSLPLSAPTDILTVATVSNLSAPLKSILTAIGENPSSLATSTLSLSSLVTSVSVQAPTITAVKSDAATGVGTGVSNGATFTVAMLACLLRLVFN